MAAPRDSRLASMDTVFKALGDPTRLRILGLLVGGEVCVCDIHQSLGIPQPRASRHLSYLRRAGLVKTRKDGLWVHYQLAPLDDTVTRALMASVTHCLSHVEACCRDFERLEKKPAAVHLVRTNIPPSIAAARHAGPRPPIGAATAIGAPRSVPEKLRAFSPWQRASCYLVWC